MSKKIVAIGGGGIGIKRGKNHETNDASLVINEIIRLTEKKHPKFLYMCHTHPESVVRQQQYFNSIDNILKYDYYCEGLFLSTEDIKNNDLAREIVDQADIIYEDGGNTKIMINRWRKFGFDKILKVAYESGKVMCGLSAGANCWFKACSSDYLKYEDGDMFAEFRSLDCLGFHEGFFVPHSDEMDRENSAKKFLKENDMIGLLVSNGAALEIVDDKYRVLTGTPEHFRVFPYAKKAYWKDNKYYEEKLDLSLKFKDTSKLLEKN